MVAVVSLQGLANPCIPKCGSSWLSARCSLGLCVRCYWCFVCALKILSHLTVVLGQASALGELSSLAEQLLAQMGSSCAQHCCQLVVGNPMVWHQCPYSQLQC